MKKFLIAGLVIFVVAGGAFWWQRRTAKKTPPTLATATRGIITRTVAASGKVQPFTTVDVKSKASGTVIRMAVEEGTAVRTGQLICLIDRRDNEDAYEQALSDVAAARGAVAAAKSTVELNRAQLEPDLDRARETVAAAAARVQGARGAVVQQQENTVASRRDAQAALHAAEARLRSSRLEAETQPGLTEAAIAVAQATVATAKANLQSAQESLHQLQTSTQVQNEASVRSEVARAESNLSAAEKNQARQQRLFDQGAIAGSVVEQSQNQREVAEASLRDARKKLDTLGVQQNSQVADAQAKVAAADAGLANARANLALAQLNRNQDTLKRSAMEAQLAAVQQARANLATAQANGRQVALREAELRADLATLRESQASLESTRANHFTLQARQADLLSSLANLRRRQQEATQKARNLEQTVVRASRNGLVTQKYVDAGSIVQSGDTGFSGGTSIVQLADVTHLYVDAQVDEADIGVVRAGQNVRLTLDAYPDLTFHGRVRKIFPQAEVENNVTTVKVQILVLNPDSRLRPNLNVTCDFDLESKARRLMVPTDAVREEGKKSFVMVWTPAGAQSKREVRIGVRGDDQVELLSGVKAGEKVVVTPPEKAADAGGGSM